MQILDGLLVSGAIKAQIKQEVEDWQAAGGKRPHLAAVLVGNNPASEAYVGNKVRTCGELGFESTLLRFNTDITEAELIAEVHRLNEPAIRANAGHALVLLRPDLHVAWRGDTLPDDVAALADRLTGH